MTENIVGRRFLTLAEIRTKYIPKVKTNTLPKGNVQAEVYINEKDQIVYVTPHSIKFIPLQQIGGQFVPGLEPLTRQSPSSISKVD